ncbi:uncharacterized protein LOC117890109 [Drosophila subobscura]|uniref:uncharacterized protein LOC117890109 n=1 Tax=Drosophila subobscura TaxID=7241 RepID=UPI00155AFE55|nr:uncharacterized protein LOC117890109 [Drosophila subobscura]
MGSRSRWGRIDARVTVNLVREPSMGVMKLNRRTLERRVDHQLMLMSSPVPFVNFMNKFRLDEILINHQARGVFSMRDSATVTELACYTWKIMSASDRLPYTRLAMKAREIQNARKLYFQGNSVSRIVPSRALAQN